MSPEEFKFQRSLLDNGILGYDRDSVRYLFKVAKICAKTAGVPLGAATGLMTSGIGTVAVPGVGAVPGYVVGALSGFLSGTVICTMSRMGLKKELDKLLENE